MFQKETPCAPHEHPLEFTYVYSFFLRPPGKFDPVEYAQYVQQIAAVRSVEQFWSVYRHIKRPCGEVYYHLPSACYWMEVSQIPISAGRVHEIYSDFPRTVSGLSVMNLEFISTSPSLSLFTLLIVLHSYTKHDRLFMTRTPKYPYRGSLG